MRSGEGAISELGCEWVVVLSRVVTGSRRRYPSRREEAGGCVSFPGTLSRVSSPYFSVEAGMGIVQDERVED